MQKRVPELSTADVQDNPCTAVIPELESRQAGRQAQRFRPLLFQCCVWVMVALSLAYHLRSSVPPTLFQDSSWCDLSSFEFSEEAAAFSPSQQPTGKAFQLQQREGHGTRSAGEPSLRVTRRVLSEASLGPDSPQARHSKVPLVVLRKRRGQASPLAAGEPSPSLFADVISSTLKRSPVKSLPFSPSQVEHNFCTAVTNFQHTPEP
jgi:hypothetical protein